MKKNKTTRRRPPIFEFVDEAYKIIQMYEVDKAEEILGDICNKYIADKTKDFVIDGLILLSITLGRRLYHTEKEMEALKKLLETKTKREREEEKLWKE
jgi:hypothetical protein